MKLQSCEKINILVAFPYYNNTVASFLLKYSDKIRLVIDSGAFTANSKGIEISVDEYCSFLDNLQIKPWKYFTLDVIGNPKKTMTQYKEMLNRGYNPIPIFTQGDTIENMEEYYKTSDVIGIGSLVGTKGNKEYLQWLMRHVNGRKVHWLGFTILSFIKKYKPYMCDSSSYTMGDRFGNLYLYMGNGRPLLLLKRKDFVKRPRSEIIKRIEYYGFDPKELAYEHNWVGLRNMAKISVASWVYLSREVEKKLGAKLFLAASGTHWLKILIEQFIYQTKNCRINHVSK